MATKRPPIRSLGSSASSFISLMAVAESGFGKTVLAGSADDMLIVSVDPEGTDSALYAGSKAKEVIVRSYEDMDEVYRWLRDEGHKEFGWMCVDSGPEMQKIFQGTWLEKNKANAGKRHPDVLGMDGHQVTQLQLIRFIKQINDLPMHKMWTALPMRLEDEEGEPYYLPNFHGGKGDVAQQVMGYMKVQGFGEFVETKPVKGGKPNMVRRWHFQPYGPFKGKDRYDALGAYMDNPTLPEIAATIAAKHPGRTTTGKVAPARPKKSASAGDRKTPAARRRRATSKSA